MRGYLGESPERRRVADGPDPQHATGVVAHPERPEARGRSDRQCRRPGAGPRSRPVCGSRPIDRPASRAPRPRPRRRTARHRSDAPLDPGRRDSPVFAARTRITTSAARAAGRPDLPRRRPRYRRMGCRGASPSPDDAVVRRVDVDDGIMFGTAAQTAPSPAMMPMCSAQHAPVGPTRIVVTTRFVAGSMRETDGPPPLATQTAPDPTATPPGCGPTGMVATTLAGPGIDPGDGAGPRYSRPRRPLHRQPPRPVRTGCGRADDALLPGSISRQARPLEVPGPHRPLADARIRRDPPDTSMRATTSAPRGSAGVADRARSAVAAVFAADGVAAASALMRTGCWRRSSRPTRPARPGRSRSSPPARATVRRGSAARPALSGCRRRCGSRCRPLRSATKTYLGRRGDPRRPTTDLDRVAHRTQRRRVAAQDPAALGIGHPDAAAGDRDAGRIAADVDAADCAGRRVDPHDLTVVDRSHPEVAGARGDVQRSPASKRDGRRRRRQRRRVEMQEHRRPNLERPEIVARCHEVIDRPVEPAAEEHPAGEPVEREQPPRLEGSSPTCCTEAIRRPPTRVTNVA